LKIHPAGDMRYTTYFIGAEGRVLARSFDLAPTYQAAAGERYVRARVEASNGDNAWTQPQYAAVGSR
jgi:hypothetical protein